MADSIIRGDRGRGSRFIIGDNLPRGQHEIIAYRWVSIAKALGSQAVSGSQTVQVRHARIPNDFGKAMVLLDYQDYVSNRSSGSGNRRRGWGPSRGVHNVVGGTSAAQGQ